MVRTKCELKLFFVLFLSLLIIVSFFVLINTNNINAEETQLDSNRKVVKVAFPIQQGMCEINDNGSLSGYNYDYLQKLAEYTGWDVQYVTYKDMDINDSIIEAMNMVTNGDADLIGPILKNSYTEKMYEFPDNNYGVVYTTLCSLAKSNITELNYTKINVLKVAILKTATTRNAEIVSYLDQLNVNYEFIECNSTQEQLDCLLDGTADVLSNITLSYFSETRSVAEFAPRPYYFVTTKGNTELKNELNAAIEELNYTRPFFQEKLQEKYFGDLSSGYVLTDDESEYITELQSIKVLCKDNDLPYVGRDSNGDNKGMLVSLLNDFGKINQVNIEYTFKENLADLDSEWATGNYDCMIGIPFSSTFCSKNGLIRTETVISVDLVLFAKQQTSKSLSTSTLAIYSRLADQVDLSKFGNVLQFDNPTECFKAVKNGKADYGCTDRFIAEYNILEQDNQLVILPLIEEQEEICLAVSNMMDVRFLSSLNKYIHSLSSNQKTTYISDGSHHESINGLTLFIKTNPVLANSIMAAIIVITFSAILLGIFATKSKKKNKILEENKVALNDALIHAENASHAKGDFMSRMSHEIRTPLNAIIGYLEIAKDETGNTEKTVNCLDKSQIASKQLLSIINDILDVSSIESGRMKIAKEDFDIKQMVNELTSIFYTQAKNKGIEFNVSVDSIEHEWVVGDELRVKQIMLNLLSNAIKFTPEKGVVNLGITQVGVKDDDKVLLEFKVQDSGIGMSKEFQDRMFKPFEQESASTAKMYGGTGLGLSITNNLVKMMNGQLNVISEPKKGTTFTIVLPFSTSQKSEIKNTTISTISFEKVNALVVDDVADDCEYVKKLMVRYGIKCDTVTSGKKALRRIQSRNEEGHPYNLCIIDWCMKEMNGIEVAKEIRKICGKDLPIIIATAYDYAGIADEAKKAGVDKIISKPLFQSTVFNLLVNTYGKYKVEEAKTIESVDLKGVKVILAEDNSMNMEIAVDILSKVGIEVDQVVNGKDVVDKFLASKPGDYDAILMDIQMPILDGYEATKAIRSSGHPLAKTIPIIAMTANAFNEDVSAAIAAGMNEHISKPINYQKLYEALSKYIHKKN